MATKKKPDKKPETEPKPASKPKPERRSPFCALVNFKDRNGRLYKKGDSVFASEYSDEEFAAYTTANNRVRQLVVGRK